MRKHFTSLVFFGLLALFAVVAQPALSQDKKKKGPIDPNGEPKGFHAGETARYAVWHSKRGWHVRTTTAGKKHHFTGKIHVDGGTIESIHSAHLEAKGKLQDHWKVNAARNTVEFDFRTDSGVDGIDFTVSASAKTIRFNLHIDGKQPEERIYIGQKGQHPRDDPFTLPAHPPGKKK